MGAAHPRPASLLNSLPLPRCSGPSQSSLYLQRSPSVPRGSLDQPQHKRRHLSVHRRPPTPRPPRSDLSQNALTGGLPSLWATLGALTRLDAGANYLAGPLPDAWRELGSLQELRLVSNHLSVRRCGGVPRGMLLAQLLGQGRRAGAAPGIKPAVGESLWGCLVGMPCGDALWGCRDAGGSRRGTMELRPVSDTPHLPASTATTGPHPRLVGAPALPHPPRPGQQRGRVRRRAHLAVRHAGALMLPFGFGFGFACSVPRPPGTCHISASTCKWQGFPDASPAAALAPGRSPPRPPAWGRAASWWAPPMRWPAL